MNKEKLPTPGIKKHVIYIYDIKSGIYSWHGELKNILGYSNKALSSGSKKWDEFIHPLDRKIVTKLYKAGVKSCSAYNAQYRIKTRGNKYITILDKGYYIPDKNRKPFQMIGEIADVTNKINKEAQLEKNEKEFLSIVNEMPHYIYRINLKGELTFTNEAYRKAFKLKASQILGKTAYDLHPAKYADKYFADDKKVFKSNKTFYAIEENVNKITGKKEMVEVFKIPLHDEKGRVAGLQGVYWDITERIEQRKALRSVESDYKEIFNATSEAIFIHNADTGKILDVNETGSLMYGYSREDLLKLSINDLSSGDSVFNDYNALKNIRRATEEKGLTFEWKAKKKNGTLFWVEVALRKSKIGGKGRVLAVVRDISKRKDDEKALLLSQISINTSKDAVLWFNKSGRVIYVNHAAIVMLKYSKREIYSLSINDIEKGSLSDFWKQRLEQLNKRGSLILETNFQDKNENNIPVEISVSCYNYAGEAFVFTSVRDKTERRFTEEQLKESERKYRDMTELLPQGIFECDLAGNVTYANKILFELLQRGQEELKQGFNVIDSVSVDDKQNAIENIKSLFEENVHFAHEYNMVRKDGSTFPVSIYSSVIRKEGIPVGLRGIIVDLSEKMQNEKEKLEHENLFSLLFEKAGDINFLLENDRFINCNETTIKILKAKSKKEIIQTHPWNISPEFQPDGERSSVKASRNIEIAYKEGSHKFEWVHTKFDGTNFDVEVVLTAIPIKGKWYLHAACRDITDKKNAEQKEKLYYQRLEKLLEIERKILSAQSSEKIAQTALNHLRIILDCDRASIVLFDIENDIFKVVAVDSAIETNLKVGNSYPLHNSNLRQIKEKDYKLFNDLSKETDSTPVNSELIKEGVRSRLSVPLISHNEVIGTLNLGSMIPYNFNEEKIKIAQDVSISISLALQHADFIEQINRQNSELERKVEDRTEQLRQTISELESFSYSVSHDLRAPLRSIGGFSQAVIDEYSDKLDDEGKSLLTRVVSASRRMSDLIDALLMLARITRSEMSIEKIDFSSMVSATASELQKHEEERTNVEFIIQPGLTIKGDQKLLRIAVENMLSNSWKFTKNEVKAVIEFGQTKIDEEKVFFIKDNGVGFDMAFAGKLFGAFQRLHNRDEFEGTGIGLATTKRIILRHNGSIWAESKIDEETIFYFTIRV